MKKIAVASGKGGTGKTTVSVNLYHFINKYLTQEVQLVDCDVEEPNDLLFFGNAKEVSRETINQMVPRIDNEKCTYCRKCAEWCEFNAIVVIPPVQFAEVNPSLCHSCGACLVACEYDAMKEYPEPIGEVTFYKTEEGLGLAEGRLKIGSAMQTMLIKELKKRVPDNDGIVLFDAPPGTSCPVVETVSDADYILLVTEPTPFGLHDLTLMVEMLKEIKQPFGVIVNKAGLGNNDVYDYLKKENIEIIGEIPFDKEYASKYAAGNLLQDISHETEQRYKEIIEKIKTKI
ncbi:MAG: P-loop NTPase [Chlorobi bacterium]|nr:P-loop NTPase [Chlorobiota bacterium]